MKKVLIPFIVSADIASVAECALHPMVVGGDQIEGSIFLMFKKCVLLSPLPKATQLPIGLLRLVSHS